MRARVVITLVLALLLTSCGGDGGVFSTGTTETVTTSAGSETTGGQGSTTTVGGGVVTSTTAAGGPVGLAWARIPHDDAVFGPVLGGTSASMMAVTVGGPGLVAAGYESSDAFLVAAVWTSPDGVTWSRVPHDDAVFGSASGPTALRIDSVTAGGPGLVAVGSEFSDAAGLDAAVWTSPDGVSWSRVPHDDAIFGGYNNQVMEWVVAGGPGLVAVGWDLSGADGEPAVWTSADGLTWTRVSGPVAPSAGDQTMLSVVAGGPGLVAVGSEYVSAGSDAAAWTSVDGLTWAQVPRDDAVFGGADAQSMQMVTVGGPGFVAGGYDYSGGDADAAVWTSADGVTWSRVPHSEVVFGGDGEQTISGVVAGGPGLVTVGGNFLGEDGAPLVWWSSDGAAWILLSADEVMVGEGWAGMSAVVVGGPGLVAVGDGGIGEGSNAVVWVSPPVG